MNIPFKHKVNWGLIRIPFLLEINFIDMNNSIQTIPFINLILAFIPVIVVIMIMIMWKWKAGSRNSIYAIFRMLIQRVLVVRSIEDELNKSNTITKLQQNNLCFLLGFGLCNSVQHRIQSLVPAWRGRQYRPFESLFISC